MVKKNSYKNLELRAALWELHWVLRQEDPRNMKLLANTRQAMELADDWEHMPENIFLKYDPVKDVRLMPAYSIIEGGEIHD